MNIKGLYGLAYIKKILAAISSFDGIDIALIKTKKFDRIDPFNHESMVLLCANRQYGV